VKPNVEEDRIGELHEELRALFDEARSRVEERARSFRFGPFVVRLVSLGAPLEEAHFRALAHLEKPAASQTDATIYLWDSESSSCRRPSPGWRTGDFGRKALVPGLTNHRFTTLLLRTARGLALVDQEEKAAFVWLPSPETVPWWEHAAPLRRVLDVLGESLGTTLLHAAALGTAGRGALIVGPGGSGKSTLALESIKQGLDFLADDYCLLGPASVRDCHALYGTAKKEDADLDRLGWLADLPSDCSQQGEGKRTIFVNEAWPGRLARYLRVEAILVPRFTAQGPSLAPISPRSALTSMAVSSLVQSEAHASTTLTRLAKLVKSVPAFELATPPSVEGVPPLIEGLLSGSEHPARVSSQDEV
jgi:hypothetical protein